MQIEIPDSPELTARAKAAGFEDVGEYVRDVVRRRQEPVDPPTDQVDEPQRVRIRRLREFLRANAVSGVPSIDDSRESIYGDG